MSGTPEPEIMEDITIKISKASSEVGYFYDIYFKSPDAIEEDEESEDGGMCTSEKIETAIEMASDHTIRLLKDIEEGAI